MSRSPEPKITYHPDRKRRSLSLTFPDMHALAGGAHFSAATDHPDQERQLQPISSHLSNSDVKLEGTRKQVVEDVMELFCSRPTLEIFRRSWREDATFEFGLKDPLSKCEGFDEYAPQWFSMPKLFPKSRTIRANVISSTYGPPQPNQIVYEQEQEYTIRFIGTKTVIRSLVIIDLDEHDKIIKLEDRWNGKTHPARFGAYYLRRLNAMALPYLVRVPKT
ncbi:hypothetical protein FRB99_006014 [Tulasnella sp. 403]|nr:hypothetical protein FRB99_006014 [Tulasnella sp. 403]